MRARMGESLANFAENTNNPPVRLGFVIHQFFPRHYTGTEQYARALAQEARRRGREVFIFTFEPAASVEPSGPTVEDGEYEGIPIRRVAVARRALANPVLGDWDSPIAEALFRRWLDDVRPDALHVFHLMNLGVGCALEAAVRRIPALFHATDFFIACPVATLTLPDGEACDGPPDGGFGCFGCIHPGVAEAVAKAGIFGPLHRTAHLAGPVHVHRPLLGGLALGLAGRKERLMGAVARAGCVAAPSSFLRDKLVALGLPAGVIRLVRYGLDPARLASFRDTAPQRPSTVFGYFGTIAPHKGLLQLVQAFRSTRDVADCAESRLIVRGKLEEFPEYGTAVRNEATGDPRIEFRPPFDAESLGAALSEIDCLVVPSLWHENTPFVALEALAARRPVLVSRRGGLVEVVEAGCGATFEPRSESELATRLAEFSSLSALESARSRIPKARWIDDCWRELEELLLSCEVAVASKTSHVPS